MKIGKFIKYENVLFYEHQVLENMGGVLPRVVCECKRCGEGMYINKEYRWGGGWRWGFPPPVVWGGGGGVGVRAAAGMKSVGFA